jgi:hypothetical protein
VDAEQILSRGGRARGRRAHCFTRACRQRAVGQWKLDEGHGATVADGSGNGNPGVLSGGASWVQGVFGPGLAFDGKSGQVKVTDNLALEPAMAAAPAPEAAGRAATPAAAEVHAEGPADHAVGPQPQVVELDADRQLQWPDHCSGASGFSLTYTESRPAKLTVTLLRPETGVRRAGRLTVPLNQLFRRWLTPGSYRLDATPRAQGKTGRTASLRLLVRTAHAHR